MGYRYPKLVGNEASGDFLHSSVTESIAVTEDGSKIAIGFSTTDTTIVGSGTTPKAVGLYDV